MIIHLFVTVPLIGRRAELIHWGKKMVDILMTFSIENILYHISLNVAHESTIGDRSSISVSIGAVVPKPFLETIMTQFIDTCKHREKICMFEGYSVCMLCICTCMCIYNDLFAIET